VTGATLTRFFGFHVAILPAVTTFVLALHLFLVQKHGMSVPLSVVGQNLPRMKFFPNFFLRDLIGWILAVGVLAALAALFPWQLGEKADPFAPAPAGIKPEWYFLFMFQTLKLLPGRILWIEGEVLGILAMALGAVAWLFVPFLDRPEENSRRTRWFTWGGIVLVIYIVTMTIIAYLT
jgi:cytochrome b6